jgi:uncharacterized protein YciI
MFVVLLRFTALKSQASPLMAAHNAWVQRGLDDGVFLLTGSLQPAAGGALIAHGVSQGELQGRLDDDPFVAAGIVTAEILDITPGRTDPRLAFLLNGAAAPAPAPATGSHP